MATTITLKYCGMEGTGPTVKAAKQDAASKIERLLAESWEPTYIQGRTLIGMVWRDQFAWAYCILEAPITERPCQHYNYDTREDAYRACARHMAQNEIDLDAADPYTAPDYVKNPIDRRSYADYVAWQLAARTALRQGVSNQDAHQWACEHETEYRRAS